MTTTTSLVITRAVNDRIADDAPFAAFVWRSLLRFNRGDWGDTHADDLTANDADAASLKAGHGGRVLAVYSASDSRTVAARLLRVPLWADGTNWPGDTVDARIWIIRDALAVTILFPADY